MGRFALFICSIGICFISCRKSQGVYGVNQDAKTDSGYTIKNLLDKPVSFDIYTTEPDYDSCRNVYLHGSIPAKGVSQFPLSTFKQGQGYIIDWYQDDYRGSSWMNLGAYGASDTTIFYPVLEFDLEHAYYLQLYVPQNIWRSVLLDGNKSYTLWQAVDAKKQIDSSSIWQQLSDNEKFKQIQFHKYYWCVCRSKDSTGSVAETKPAVYVTQSATDLRIMGGIFETFSSSKSLTNINDTFWAKVNSVYYAMVKVK